ALDLRSNARSAANNTNRKRREGENIHSPIYSPTFSSHHGTAGSSADCRGSSTRRQKEPHAERSRPVSSVSHRSLTHLGMDVHKDSISIGILRPETRWTWRGSSTTRSRCGGSLPGCAR